MARLRTNAVKAKLAAGKGVVGVHVTMPSPAIVELVGLAGFDYVLIDCEHGPIGLEAVENMVRAADSVGVTAFARVPRVEADVIARTLETGVLGLLLPHVIDRSDAVAAVQAARFHPLGERGMSIPRSGWYGAAEDADDYFESANREVFLMALIEHQEAIPNVADILKVEGMDACFVGTSDLSQSLGVPRRPTAGAGDHSTVVAARDEALRA
ncbi:MAG: hypothetical protein HY329_12840, partial [Chloroflexi bacterium]|nr:hypothetical protein [Chloroflexota bacterium]